MLLIDLRLQNQSGKSPRRGGSAGRSSRFNIALDEKAHGRTLTI